MWELSPSSSVILTVAFAFTDFARCYQRLLPMPTFEGLRAAQVESELRPTPNPWSPSEILKRLSGDPGICGWVEGSSNNTVSCNSGYTCAATSTFVGCCSTGAVGCEALFTTCYDRAGPSCIGACQLDSAALICEGQAPYCATYKYASGSQGYGCAAASGYNKTVLTTTTPGVTPFGQTASTTSSELSSATPTQVRSSATASPVNMKLISGGAIAGAVAGSVLALAAIVGIVLFMLRRRRLKKQQERQAATCPGPQTSCPYSDQLVYASYAKPSPAFASPSQSPPLHSRQPSDHMYMFGTSSPQSEFGNQYFSPEVVTPRLEAAELEVRDERQSLPKRLS